MAKSLLWGKANVGAVMAAARDGGGEGADVEGARVDGAEASPQPVATASKPDKIDTFPKRFEEFLVNLQVKDNKTKEVTEREFFLYEDFVMYTVYRYPHPVTVTPSEVCSLALAAASEGGADEREETKKLEEAEQRAQVAQEVLKVFAPSNGNIKKTLQALEHVQKILKNDEPGGEEEGGGQ